MITEVDLERVLDEQLPNIPKGVVDRITSGEFRFYDEEIQREVPFEMGYRSVTDYPRKAALAYALMVDDRYKLQDIRLLGSEFIRPGQEMNPQIEELNKNVQQAVHEELLRRGDPRETIHTADELRGFAHDVAEGKTVDAQDFRRLVGLFGSSQVVDILYSTRPEFRGYPVEQVKSILADYLGDFLLQPGFFNPGDLEVGLKYLGDSNLQEGLVEVMKDGCLSFYNFCKKRDSDTPNKEIFDEYFDYLDLEMERFDNEDLRGVVSRTREYYSSLLAISKPTNMVDVIREGREFPDVNQLINMKELEDKRRVVNADEMRMGKSAAPIIEKERLGIAQAVIVAPSNVINTWLGYLSDRVEDGRQIGYFKEGHAPRVLVVENQNTFAREDFNSYDYVILSHERLNDAYMSHLETVDFGMLIVDEVHKLKNLQNGVWAANLLRLVSVTDRNNGYLVMLSGTPVPNKIHDVAMLLKLLYPDRFRDVSNAQMIHDIIHGDVIDLRSLLIPRMQMKEFQNSAEVRPHTETIQWVELSDVEREIYGVLMEEDELDPTEKMRILRQFLLNPSMLDITPGILSSKIAAVREYMHLAFQAYDKVVMFVNGFVENILRGDRQILPQLDLPEGVDIKTIMGGVSQAERAVIQSALNYSDRRMLVAINGQTADVGNDFAGGQALAFYNEAWTRYEKNQQEARLLGDRVLDPLKSTTFIVRGTIEEGIHEYIEIKYRAIQKLLHGVPIQELEREMLEQTEDTPDLSVNPELAQYYISSWDRMRGIFSRMKDIGEETFVQFLTRYGKDYADCYTDLGSRSYQANACRISGSIIDSLIRSHNLDPREVKVLDIASGPEMLRRHIGDAYHDSVISLDINQFHFLREGGTRVLGSFLQLPFQDESVDIASLSLSLHYARFAPSKGEVERLKVLLEMNRVLKVGGEAVINQIYSVDIKDFEQFRQVVETLGFTIIDEYSGEVNVGQQYRSRVITLRKESNVEQDLADILEAIGKENFDGLKFVRVSQGLRDPRRIVKEFSINGTDLHVNFNQADLVVIQEEETIIANGEYLKKQFGGVDRIPTETVIQNNFVRLLIGKHYALFKRLQSGDGAVVIR